MSKFTKQLGSVMVKRSFPSLPDYIAGNGGANLAKGTLFGAVSGGIGNNLVDVQDKENHKLKQRLMNILAGAGIGAGVGVGATGLANTYTNIRDNLK